MMRPIINRSAACTHFMIVSMRAAVVTVCLMGTTAAHAAVPDWDRVANVKHAAEQIGDIQAKGGAERAFRFITACYKTHSLASAYSRPFESCIAQDFMLSQTLALIYERLDPAVLKRIGVPTKDMLQQSLNQRVNGAYANYQMPPSEGYALKAIVDEHGMPVFFKYVFPKGDVPNSAAPAGSKP